MTIRADFTAGGFSKKAQCVYLLTIQGPRDTWHYVGRTGTSNKTGISSPYQRLAKHLAKSGKTQSAIWDSRCLSPDDLDRAAISFVALPIARDDELKLAEEWLRWHSAGERSLNKEKPPVSEPVISAELRSRLCSTFAFR